MLEIERSWATTPGWSRGHFEAELDNERAYFCVAEEQGRVAGYAGLRLIPPEAQVTTLAVRRDRSGRGLGRGLLEHLHARALAEGCARMTLEVSSRNEPALRLYARKGYRIVGSRSKYYNDGSDALLMSFSQ